MSGALVLAALKPERSTCISPGFEKSCKMTRTNRGCCSLCGARAICLRCCPWRTCIHETSLAVLVSVCPGRLDRRRDHGMAHHRSLTAGSGGGLGAPSGGTRRKYRPGTVAYGRSAHALDREGSCETLLRLSTFLFAASI